MSSLIAKRVYIGIDLVSGPRARERMNEALAALYGARVPYIESAAVAGTLAECADGVQRVIDAGAQMILFTPLYDQAEHMELIADLIIPALQRTATARYPAFRRPLLLAVISIIRQRRVLLARASRRSRPACPPRPASLSPSCCYQIDGRNASPQDLWPFPAAYRGCFAAYVVDYWGKTSWYRNREAVRESSRVR